jgi:hypothetical protein
MWSVLDREGPRTVGFERIRCRDWRRHVLVDAVDDECYEIGTGASCAITPVVMQPATRYRNPELRELFCRAYDWRPARRAEPDPRPPRQIPRAYLPRLCTASRASATSTRSQAARPICAACRTVPEPRIPEPGPMAACFGVTGGNRRSLDLRRGPRGATLTVNLLTIFSENCSLLLAGRGKCAACQTPHLAAR